LIKTNSILVAGSYGKTTISAIISHIMPMPITSLADRRWTALRHSNFPIPIGQSLKPMNQSMS